MTRPRLLLLGVAAAAATAMLGLGSWRWTIDPQAVRGPLEQALARDFGYRVTALGGAAFTALPWPVLQVTGLELAKGRGSAETAAIPLLKARLNIYSWLVGDPRITALSLFEPQIRLMSDENIEETEAVGAVIRNFLRRDRRPSLTHLRVQAGEVTLDGARWLSGLGVVVSNIAASDFRLDAAGRYRSQPLELTAVVAPSAAQRRPLTWRLALGDIRASFDGALVAPPALDADGRLSVTLGAGALRSRPLSLSRWTADLLDGVTVSGEGRVALPAIILREARIRRGPYVLTGGLDLNISAAQPRVAATLHADQLDLSSLAPALRAVAANGWPAETLGATWLSTAAADIRLSAETMVLDGLRIRNAAVSAKLGGGRAEASLNQGEVGGGTMKGRFSAQAVGQTIEARLSAQADRIDFAAAAERGSPALSGVVSGHLALDLRGRSLAEMAAGASCRGLTVVRNGDFGGFDAEAYLRRPDAPGLPAGRSRFKTAELAWRMDGGRLAVTQAGAAGSVWSLRAEGGLSLPERRLDLLARITLDGAGPAREERAVRLSGPWLDLQAVPVPAAAPGRS
jgi:AsmA protein